jgi:ribonuclease PH
MDLQRVIETAVVQSVVPDTLPGSQLQISVLISDADGSVEACAVNAVTLAVADAGV